ncbi:MAG TPA: GNAT family N-acetyltransferase [Gemmatimonadaceae bacterium]|nr:GNAT family N-acetyltransferase [Gemmatimonadaceae bacterium]
MPSSEPVSRAARFVVRDFTESDADAVNATAVAAFSDFKDTIDDWPKMERAVSQMSALTSVAELIVAAVDGVVAGAVGYGGPGKPKQEWFDPAWPVVRMLVVHPQYRGLGIGRALTEECVRRARRDGAPLIALHTATIMTTALDMYLRMGFELYREEPPRFGVQYAVYLKKLDQPLAGAT